MKILHGTLFTLFIGGILLAQSGCQKSTGDIPRKPSGGSTGTTATQPATPDAQQTTLGAQQNVPPITINQTQNSRQRGEKLPPPLVMTPDNVPKELPPGIKPPPPPSGK